MTARTRVHRAGAALLVGGIALTLAACTAPAPSPTRAVTTPTPTPSAARTQDPAERLRLEDAMFARLPKGARADPAFTWTDGSRGASGSAIDTEGRRMLLAVACEGGGSVAVSISSRPDRIVDCARLVTLGPIDLTAAAGMDPPGSLEYGVAAASGAPRYVAKAVAVPDR